jgi:maleate isomerase
MTAEPQSTAVRQELNRILADLLRTTDASRTTIRLDLPQFGFHVDDPAGEARTDEAPALSGQTALDQRSLATVRWLEINKFSLIQSDCANADPAPPEALMNFYGVKAQMLGPIIRDDKLVGWISVHENRATRQWSETDVDHLTSALHQVDSLLARNGV